MRKFYKFLILSFFIPVFFSCPDKLDNLNIAVFKSGSVTFKEAMNEYNGLKDEERDNIRDINAYFRLVRKVALEKIILNRVYRDKLDQEQGIKEKINEARLSSAKELVFEKQINSKIVVTEAHYKKYSKVYELYQIVKKTDILDENKIKESKKLLENISKQIKNIDDFMKMAKLYSDDISGKEGGYIGKIRLGIMEEAIDEELKKMDVNKVSNIVESSTGCHIFFIKSIEEIKTAELLKDRNLYELIYNDEKARLEDEWYKKLLKDGNLKIFKERIFDLSPESGIVIQYKKDKITKKDFNETVNKYKISSFPEPSKEDLTRLLENLGIELIINELARANNIINSNELKEKFKKENDFLLIDAFIEKKLAVKEIKDQDIKEFYEKNKINLFTHYDKNNRVYVQPLKDVTKFIEQKLSVENMQNARYDLYKKLVSEDELKIDETLLKKLKEKVDMK